ncbi:hypothetical protein ABZ399_09790 [Micromonospora aurantiaca]|uniref:tetratricopeptide repeat protein n=1 Tax=Micromonospora aurantiaca (nom. illeg.) TaxID=47850 RepID=UPI00340683ED
MTKASEDPDAISTSERSDTCTGAASDSPAESDLSRGTIAQRRGLPSVESPTPRDEDAENGRANADEKPSPPIRLALTTSDLNERFAKWRDKSATRWSISISLITILCGTLGTLSDWQGAKPVFPCWVKREQKINEPYGIAVANIGVRREDGQRWSDMEKKNASDINESLFKQVSSSFEDRSGQVGIGQTCNRNIQSDQERETYLSEVQKKLDAELAVSLTLTPSGQRVRVEIEASIGSQGGWNEAQELAGYYKFNAGLVGDSLEIRTSIAKASVGELLVPYITLLRAIAEYANSDYGVAKDTLSKVLATPGISDDLKRLALVLKGNTEGRLGGTGSTERAAAAYTAALKTDRGYVRAILGLAEIDYQTGLSKIRSTGGPRCEGKLTSQAKAHLAAALDKYEGVYRSAATSRVPDVDARAKFGIGRTYACLLRSGDRSKAEAALEALKYVTARFESDRKKVWLRSTASGAYGETALIYCGQGRREEALAYYAKAYEWAVDETRARDYDDARRRISTNRRYCS